jgi:hypothetical protein
MVQKYRVMLPFVREGQILLGTLVYLDNSSDIADGFVSDYQDEDHLTTITLFSPQEMPQNWHTSVRAEILSSQLDASELESDMSRALCPKKAS